MNVIGRNFTGAAANQKQPNSMNNLVNKMKMGKPAEAAGGLAQIPAFKGKDFKQTQVQNQMS